MNKFPIIVGGGLLGGAVLFVWGAVSWMVLSWHKPTVHQFKYEVAVEQALVANTNPHGKAVYLLPASHHSGAKGEKALAQDKTQKKPFAFVVFNPSGYRRMKLNLILAFLVQTIGAMFVTWLLLQVGKANYLQKVSFIVAFAIAAGIVCYIPNWVWWGFPRDFTLVSVADLVIGWFLAGLVIARITKTK